MLYIDTNSPWFTELTAQFAHAGCACAIVLSFAHFGHEVAGVGVILAWAVLKEFVFDALVERQPLRSNLLDFSMYITGTVVAVIELALRA